GIVFIGPTSRVIVTMGSKIAARDVVLKAGIPTIPGSVGNLNTIEEAVACAKTLGYPVMLKATFGGGGRGIRLCNDANQVRQQFARVQSEAEKSFGDAHVYMEQYIANPRHIEVQIMADHMGNVVHLFERDCSVQRRHQKLVEIAPSPLLDPLTREILFCI
ncbi:MAG: ATP-grasp domain-containing protein, partial [Gammaproteobacteria bacterium]|nr:ATP-grasp domain-containing protein [Gammaproteobacteria bacterium]